MCHAPHPVQRRCDLSSGAFNQDVASAGVPDMGPDRPLIASFSIEMTIVQAARAGAMDWELAASAAEAGALGSLPSAMLNAQQDRGQMAKIRARTKKPINLRFVCHSPPTL